jgi:hypothetical protein
MLIGGRYKFVRMHGEPMRYRKAAIRGFQVTATHDEADYLEMSSRRTVRDRRRVKDGLWCCGDREAGRDRPKIARLPRSNRFTCDTLTVTPQSRPMPRVLHVPRYKELGHADRTAD